MTRDELIERYMPLAKKIAGIYSRTKPGGRRHCEDFLSVASLALTTGAESCIKSDVLQEKIEYYLRRVIRNKLDAYIRELALIGPTARAQEIAESKGTDSVEIATVRSDFEESHSQSLPQADDTRDLINHCCETELETQVIELRAQGHVDAEIAERLKVSPSSVYRSRKRVEARFDAACQSLGA